MSKIASPSEFDVIVVGSGAGALTAAIRAADQSLSVLVIEKSASYGGTSAISGGIVWIPNNHQQSAHAIRDSHDAALSYLRAAIKGMVSEARLEAYLEHAPKMVQWLGQATPVRYVVVPTYPDYYQGLPGALPGGRPMDPELFDLTSLGDEEEARLRPPSPAVMLMGKAAMTSRQAALLINRRRGWQFLVLRILGRYYLDLFRRIRTKRDRYVGLGNSLVAGLRKAMLERGIPLWLNTEFKELIVENGRVRGVVASQAEGAIRLRARRAVILASGGFEQNQALREKYLPQPTRAAWSATPPGNNDGAALQAALAIGAGTALLHTAWWVPTVAVPDEEKPRGVFAERAQAGCVAVNGKGLRFANEAGPYLEFVQAMYADRTKYGGGNVPAWLIFDAAFRWKYPMGPLMPAQIAPDRPSWEGVVYWKGNSLDELAGKIGVDASGLRKTVDRCNAHARSGKDLEFDKGGNVFDRYYSDVNVAPNSCLAPIEKPPFYAIRLDAGDTGTKGGILTDERARVVDHNGQPIAGLYAIGNCTASVMGESYPGAGATLGPALTFGYIAANHIAGQPA